MRETDHLIALARACLVRITVAGQVGSGFLAAPGYVLSCAHVVGAGRTATVEWNGQKYEAAVRYAEPAPVHRSRALLDYPDLAVLELLDPPADHPCAWLDFRLPSPGKTLIAIGHSNVFTPEWTPSDVSVRYDGRYGPWLRFVDCELAPGMSGGPVFNPRSGGVCALTKANQLANTRLGGLAVPLRGLRRADPGLYRELCRAHDRYHAGAGRPWASTVDTLVADGVRIEDAEQRPLPAWPGGGRRYELWPAEERALRAVLAALPEAGDHAARFTRAGPAVCPAPADVLHDHGDVVTELAGMVPPRSGLPYVLAYAADLARDEPGGPLHNWVLVTAGAAQCGEEALARLRPAERRTSRESVMVRLRPAGNDHDRYELTLWHYLDPGRIVPTVHDGQPVPFEQIRDRLHELLPDQLLALAERTTDADPAALVEFLLPPELLDADVDTWRPWPQDWARLGRRHPVVVRDLARVESGRRHPAWEHRWRRLDGADLSQALAFVACDDTADHEAMEGRIEEEPGLSVLVLATSPGYPSAKVALEVGLPAGVPVMLWRRGGCAGCAGGTCPGRAFLAGLREKLRGTTAAQLPYRIKELRNQAARANDPAHCGAGVVLLWDDPHRRPPRDRMVHPQERQLDG
jgi:hypothetical protein